MSEEFFDCSTMLMNIDRLKREIYSNILNDRHNDNEQLTDNLLVEVRRLQLWTKTMKDKHASRNY